MTANVFQNVLARHDPHCEYYTSLLRRLASRPVQWYTTSFDWNLALTFWEQFKGAGVDEACQDAYWGLLNQVKAYPLERSVWELSGELQIGNFCDALRLATAIDQAVDVIVTQEPQQFARTVVDSYRAQVDGYFYITLPTICAETGREVNNHIGVFSVGAFLLNLDNIGRLPLVMQLPRSESLRIESLQMIVSDESEATIFLKGCADRITVTARGRTPFEAIQRAIDQAVDEWYDMPIRQLVRFWIRPSTLTGADSPVEMVVGVECGDLNFESSACSGNCIRAAADAYVKVINSICEHLKLKVRDKEI
ncbi:hypothetical protein JOY44_19840 [Phormidium sp. CLA17]|uniref:alpha-isopropylmalate synthase regulatory domain-containing protein n=1 Tax=Leptolyngbya sp. Cla-17 TaxID=2803751 RepID=UPI001932644E|nr:alpha-isopropylmalate synthase regulatory domain-containing protein [Leptolyngbya sp. Cla-17]MBM0743843.1 hypothetical protein [Leptolyngbya sp. Cla-17]